MLNFGFRECSCSAPPPLLRTCSPGAWSLPLPSPETTKRFSRVLSECTAVGPAEPTAKPNNALPPGFENEVTTSRPQIKRLTQRGSDHWLPEAEWSQRHCGAQRQSNLVRARLAPRGMRMVEGNDVGGKGRNLRRRRFVSLIDFGSQLPQSNV